jgi:glycosyltransferase involved in cell wall biosynthesis
MRILPIVMTINEERFIRQCLMPLSKSFPVVIVGDTGSTDGTLEQIAQVPNIHLVHYPKSNMEEVGRIRGYLQAIAKVEFDATHVMQVDGDEIYSSSYLKYILENPMPDTAVGGYTHGIDVEELENGEIWQYTAFCSRLAVFSTESKWHGTYPFEAPSSWQVDDPTLNYYWPEVEPPNSYYHMHHLKRSSKDAEVCMRVQKQHQFSLQDRPDLKPTVFWLKNWNDYEDE